jgi:hypothetical protein
MGNTAFAEWRKRSLPRHLREFHVFVAGPNRLAFGRGAAVKPGGPPYRINAKPCEVELQVSEIGSWQAPNNVAPAFAVARAS